MIFSGIFTSLLIGSVIIGRTFTHNNNNVNSDKEKVWEKFKVNNFCKSCLIKLKFCLTLV